MKIFMIDAVYRCSSSTVPFGVPVRSTVLNDINSLMSVYVWPTYTLRYDNSTVLFVLHSRQDALYIEDVVPLNAYNNRP
jgi:hypothetical protein